MALTKHWKKNYRHKFWSGQSKIEKNKVFLRHKNFGTGGIFLGGSLIMTFWVSKVDLKSPHFKKLQIF